MNETWQICYIFVDWLRSFHDYSYILYNYKLRDTNSKIEIKLAENEIINRFKKEEITAEEVEGLKTTMSSFEQFKGRI